MMEWASNLLEIIHVNVFGPMSVVACGGYRYFPTFTDDLSRYGDIYLMKHKSETFERFKQFRSEVEDHRDKKIKCLRYYRGGKYLSCKFGIQLKTMWKLFHNSRHLEHHSDGMSEHRSRALLDMVQTMMSLIDITTIVLGLCIRDNHIHFKRGTI